MIQDAGTLERPARSEPLPAPSETSPTVRGAPEEETPFRRREPVVLAILLALLGIAAYGSYIQHAGFVTDDWALQKTWAITTHGGQLSHVGSFLGSTTGRPALSLYFTVVELVLGFHQGLHLALALLTAIVFSITIYLVLRKLGLTRAPSGIIAALTLLFPGADSLRLWSIMGDGSYALSLLLLGLLLTLHSFDADGRRRVALRGAGLALYALSLTTYEIGMLPLAISFVLYRCRVRWGRAFREWAMDLPVIVLVYVLATSHTGSQRLSTSGTMHHALQIARDGLKLMGATVLPFGGSGWITLGFAAAVIAIAAIFAVRLSPGDPRRIELRRWLALIVVASLLAAASYAVYAPGWTGYTPLAPGLGNRVNALGAPLLIAIAYSIGSLAALLLCWRLRDRQRYAAALAAGFGVLLAGFYFVQTHNDANTWGRAYARAEQVLYVMQKHLPKPPSGSLVVSFGQPVQENASVPIWATTWDLDGAVAFRYHDMTLDAMPGIPGTTIECGLTSAGPVDHLLPTLFTRVDWRPYGKLYLFSIDGRWVAPKNRSQCLRVAPKYLPGLWTVPNG